MGKRKKINKLIKFLKTDIWLIPREELTPVRAFLIRQLQIFTVALRGLNEDSIYLRASALTFFTLLSLVPFVAMAFGIATGFGLEEYLVAQLEQAFIGREDVLEFILEFAESLLETTQGGIMAAVGLGFLFYTVMKVLGHMEESFNEIWQIRQERSFSRKFTDYMAIMMIAPFFIILSNIVTVFLTTQIEELTLQIHLLGFFSPVILTVLRILPFVLVWILLTILYIVMPNTRVNFKSALIAGIIAGTLFQLVQYGYIYFQVGVARYSTIYGSFAALPLLMFWMQISWVVVLFGAELSFANQNIEQYEYEAESLNMSLYNRRLITFYIAHLLIKNFENGVPPYTARQISDKLRVPIRLVRYILNDLTEINILSETRTNNARDTAYQPATDINKITIKYLGDKLDHRGMDVLFAKQSKEIGRIKSIMESFNKDVENHPENKLLKDI
jgi:membrane protein